MENKDQLVDLKLDVKSVNQIINSLAKQPFVEVHLLVVEIQRQATDSLKSKEEVADE